jgi:ferric-dicitrate binding protein FerR (iron transport regulator)
MNKEEQDILIAKVICGEANLEELNQFNQLIDADVSLKSEFEKSKIALNKFKEIPEFNTEEAWMKMKNRISKNQTKRFQLNPFIRTIAASLIIIGIGSLLLVKIKQNQNKIAVSTQNQTIKEKLPDGSQISLNKESSIEYDFSKNENRTIKLKGEAFFEVVHDEKKPFIVEVEDLKITDIGTSFLVRENEKQNEVTVSVEEGIVLLEQNKTKIELLAGEQATYYAETGKIVKLKIPTKIRPSYASKILKFNRTTLNDAIENVNSMYGTNIILSSKQIQNCEITASFTDENPDIILQVICETLHLDMKKNNNQIILSGIGCNQP